MTDSFKTENLNPKDWQFQITHKCVSDFNCGDLVFLKSSPDIEMTVCGLSDGEIQVSFICSRGINRSCSFSPEMILQYKYSGLVVGRRKFKISLN